MRKLKPQLPKTQFVMVTLYQDADHIYEALAASASGHLLTQTPMDELLTAIAAVHGGGSPMSSSIVRRVIQGFVFNRAGVPGGVKLSTREKEVLELWRAVTFSRMWPGG